MNFVEEVVLSTKNPRANQSITRVFSLLNCHL